MEGLLFHEPLTTRARLRYHDTSEELWSPVERELTRDRDRTAPRGATMAEWGQIGVLASD